MEIVSFKAFNDYVLHSYSINGCFSRYKQSEMKYKFSVKTSPRGSPFCCTSINKTSSSRFRHYVNHCYGGANCQTPIMSSKSLTSATAVAASSRAMRLSSSSEQLINQIEEIQSCYNSCGTEVKPKQSKSFNKGNETRLKNAEELASKIKQKFKKAKKYVDIDLVKFTQDLNDMLKKTNDSKPEFSSSMGNILSITDQCLKTSADEFWFNCEGIVHELDDQRKELPNGTLKRAYTNLLFVLTRCTRLVQASKEDKIHHQEFCFLNGEYFR